MGEKSPGKRDEIGSERGRKREGGEGRRERPDASYHDAQGATLRASSLEGERDEGGGDASLSLSLSRSLALTLEEHY